MRYGLLLGNSNCPAQNTSDIIRWEHLSDLDLVNVEQNDVKVLIGANVPRAHLQLECREGMSSGPVAIQTQLGWCLMGASSAEDRTCYSARVNLLVTQEHDLDQQIERFWQTESFGVTVDLESSVSVEDKSAMDALNRNTKLVNGHYVVPMLWKREHPHLPDNREMAERRFKALSKRLDTDFSIKTKYTEVLNGYINKGHARKLTQEEVAESSERTWYLPHFCVVNPRKPQKVRVVFDAAAKFDNASLNNELLTGPDLNNSLFGVIQRFRTKPIALVADIADMFHQVHVPKADADALRFLWKEDLDHPGPPDVYQMLVHIFGATDSPCCAKFALRNVALEERRQPLSIEASRTILNNFYVDDMLKSTTDETEAISLAAELTGLLSHRGFTLTKWMSSSKAILATIPQSMRASHLNLDLDDLPVDRALGVQWNVKDDVFTFKQELKPRADTKRGVISSVSSVFDPCGFLAPLTFRAKCLIQELWRSGIGWDEVLPEFLLQQWREWLDDLHFLSDLAIPRYLGSSSDIKYLELHLFSDASEAGFASVAYLRCVKVNGSIHCVFIAGRSHVAPVRQSLTIPKLELQGAVMSTRLSKILIRELHLDIRQVFYWTDALTVLRYISNTSKRWKIFVANRISEIRESTKPEQWRYVASHDNPADKATRKLPMTQLTLTEIWFHGPQFLWQDESQWPVQVPVGQPDDNDENLKKNVNLTVATKQMEDMNKLNLDSVIEPGKFSSWHNLQKKVAWIYRAARNFLSSCSRFNIAHIGEKELTCDEMKDAATYLVRRAQREGFTKDFNLLCSGVELHENSKLLPLNPFFDFSSNTMRVGGRLRRDGSNFENKHQLLLPYDHWITYLVAEDSHRVLAHCGPEHMIANIRLKYWPVKCRMIAKKVIHNCMDCRRRSVRPRIPRMADLPAPRISSYTRPFTYTGVDYFGPLIVKQRRSRVKRWGCLFTCLTTRAVHLEIAESLDTDDFIMVLSCFISRRGKPCEIFSDNGTNFRGAERELQESLSHIHQDKVQQFLLRRDIKWNFIPPMHHTLEEHGKDSFEL